MNNHFSFHSYTSFNLVLRKLNFFASYQYELLSEGFITRIFPSKIRERRTFIKLNNLNAKSGFFVLNLKNISAINIIQQKRFS
jgi:hypothetical protein